MEVTLAWDLSLAACSSLDRGLCRPPLGAAAPECPCDAVSLYPLPRSLTPQRLAKWLFHPWVKFFVNTCGLACCVAWSNLRTPSPWGAAEASRQELRFLTLTWGRSWLLVMGQMVQPLVQGVCSHGQSYKVPLFPCRVTAPPPFSCWKLKTAPLVLPAATSPVVVPRGHCLMGWGPNPLGWTLLTVASTQISCFSPWNHQCENPDSPSKLPTAGDTGRVNPGGCIKAPGIAEPITQGSVFHFFTS